MAPSITSPVALLTTWIVATTAGLFWLADYSAAPGAATSAPQHWPVDAALTRTVERSILMMFVHPHCPCSRASLNELARLAPRVRSRTQIEVVFVPADETSTDYSQNALWQQANEIPGVHTHVDASRELSRMFGARTSGHALLYDGTGALRFSGGLTPGRGHEGDAPAQATVIAMLGSDPPQVVQECCAWGCPLTGKTLTEVEDSPQGF